MDFIYRIYSENLNIKIQYAAKNPGVSFVDKNKIPCTT